MRKATKLNTNKKYQVIYADPPWKYKDKALSGNRGAELKYPCLSMSALKRLPVSKLAAKDCTLFLWVTLPFLKECFTIAEAWGFEKYKSLGFVWIKQNKKANTLFWGMGHGTRQNAELCLRFVKGKPKRVDAGVHSVVISKIEKHSKKPGEVRKRIEQLLGDVPRIELFARERIKGWDSWGNEI